jgi:hypothetical protein
LHFRGSERSHISKFSGPSPQGSYLWRWLTPPQSKNASAVPGHRMTSRIFLRFHGFTLVKRAPPLVNLVIQHCLSVAKISLQISEKVLTGVATENYLVKVET